MLQLGSYNLIKEKEFNSILNSFVPAINTRLNLILNSDNTFTYYYPAITRCYAEKLSQLLTKLLNSSNFRSVKVKDMYFGVSRELILLNETVRGVLCFINPYKYYHDNTTKNNLIYLIDKDIKENYKSLYSKMMSFYKDNNIPVLEVDNIHNYCYTSYIEPNFNSVNEVLNYEINLKNSFINSLKNDTSN